ncbi:MAG: hypothetical protein HYV09_15230 [Deltaproteobacteria bacterium]|nr:hypothetical protein [Deltaproteobacteria bacterium]
MSLPHDLLDEIERLITAYSSTRNVVYLAEARVRIDAAGERLARHRGAVEAIEAEIERVARVAREGSR